MLGGIFLGGYVDRTKKYKGVTLACIAMTLCTLVFLSSGGSPRSIIIVALVALGGFIGPVQPINAELAVEVNLGYSSRLFISAMYLGHISAMSRMYLGYSSLLLISAISRLYPVHISSIYLGYISRQVAYPADENAIEAVQQLCGNLFSALLVPIAEHAQELQITTPGIGPFTPTSLNGATCRDIAEI